MIQILNRWTVLGSVALILSIGVTAHSQTDDAKKSQAIIAFSLDIEKMFASKELAAFNRETFAKLSGMDEESKAVFLRCKKIDAIAAAPKGVSGPEELMQTEFLLKMHFSDEAAAKKWEEKLENGFRKVERNGKTVWQAEGPGAPPFFAQRSGTQIHFGSEGFLLTSESIELSSTLKELINQNSSSQAYLVADMDGARDLLSEVATRASEGADLMTKQYIGLMNEVATLGLSISFDQSNLLSVVLTGHSEKEAKSIKLKMDAAVGLMETAAKFGMAQMEKESPPMAKLAGEMIAGIEVKKAGMAAVVDVTKPDGFGEMVLEAAKSAQASAKKISELNNMRQVALAMHNYYDVYKKFPFPEDTKSESLSWRVAVLPFLEEQDLYKQFDRDSDWKSGGNQSLTSKMPDLFKVGTGGVISFVMPKDVPRGFGDIHDGSSNTIALIENRRAQMVPWTKPSGVTPKMVADMVSKLADGDSLIVAFYDGSVRRVSNQTSKDTIMRLCTPKGGEIIDIEDIE